MFSFRFGNHFLIRNSINIREVHGYIQPSRYLKLLTFYLHLLTDFLIFFKKLCKLNQNIKVKHFVLRYFLVHPSRCLADLSVYDSCHVVWVSVTNVFPIVTTLAAHSHNIDFYHVILHIDYMHIKELKKYWSYLICKIYVSCVTRYLILCSQSVT